MVWVLGGCMIRKWKWSSLTYYSYFRMVILASLFLLKSCRLTTRNIGCSSCRLVCQRVRMSILGFGFALRSALTFARDLGPLYLLESSCKKSHLAVLQHPKA